MRRNYPEIFIAQPPGAQLNLVYVQTDSRLGLDKNSWSAQQSVLSIPGQYLANLELKLTNKSGNDKAG